MPISDYAAIITGGLTLAGVGFGGWITYTIQSRIAAQNIATQHELAAAQREQALFDKRATAYTDLISVLLREPSQITRISADEVRIRALRDEVIPWEHALVKALGPIHVYGTPELIHIASWTGKALAGNIHDITWLVQEYEKNPEQHSDPEQRDRLLRFGVFELCLENAKYNRVLMEALRQDLAGRYTQEMAERDVEESNDGAETSVNAWAALRNPKTDASGSDNGS